MTRQQDRGSGRHPGSSCRRTDGTGSCLETEGLKAFLPLHASRSAPEDVGTAGTGTPSGEGSAMSRVDMGRMAGKASFQDSFRAWLWNPEPGWA